MYDERALPPPMVSHTVVALAWVFQATVGSFVVVATINATIVAAIIGLCGQILVALMMIYGPRIAAREKRREPETVKDEPDQDAPPR